MCVYTRLAIEVMCIYTLLCPFTCPIIKYTVIPVYPHTDDSPSTMYVDITDHNACTFTTKFLMMGFQVSKHVEDICD